MHLANDWLDDNRARGKFCCGVLYREARHIDHLTPTLSLMTH